MTTVKKMQNGEYFIMKRDRHNITHSCYFRACASGTTTQTVNLGNVHVPIEMFGKKIRFKVEIMEGGR